MPGKSPEANWPNGVRSRLVPTSTSPSALAVVYTEGITGGEIILRPQPWMLMSISGFLQQRREQAYARQIPEANWPSGVRSRLVPTSTSPSVLAVLYAEGITGGEVVLRPQPWM